MELRMGLGTDQLELPAHVAALPSAPRIDVRCEPVHLPDGAALAGLAPWAQRMQLPGIDA